MFIKLTVFFLLLATAYLYKDYDVSTITFIKTNSYYGIKVTDKI